VKVVPALLVNDVRWKPVPLSATVLLSGGRVVVESVLDPVAPPAGSLVTGSVPEGPVAVAASVVVAAVVGAAVVGAAAILRHAAA
jgi:hypothetical protein